MTKYILAIDVGGTKIHLGLMRIDAADGSSSALRSQGSGAVQLVDELRIPASQYRSLGAFIVHWTQAVCARPAAAGFQLPDAIAAIAIGAAGPVRNQYCQLTNLSWAIDARSLGREIRESRSQLRTASAEAGKLCDQLAGLPTERICVMNDLEAIGFAIAALEDEISAGAASGSKDNRLSPSTDARYFTVRHGSATDSGSAGNAAILAPGTGLGEAILFSSSADGRLSPSASEGSHASFAPTTAIEIELLNFLLTRFPHVSFERVAGGRDGFRNILDFMVASGRLNAAQELVVNCRDVVDCGPPVLSAAEAGHPEAEAVLALYLQILGSEAGNLALKSLSKRGLWLAGGIPPRILPWLTGERKLPGDRGFLGAMTAKGRFHDLLATIPVRVLTDSGAALRGAALGAYLRMR